MRAHVHRAANVKLWDIEVAKVFRDCESVIRRSHLGATPMGPNKWAARQTDLARAEWEHDLVAIHCADGRSRIDVREETAPAVMNKCAESPEPPR